MVELVLLVLEERQTVGGSVVEVEVLAHNGNNGSGGTYNGSSNVSGGQYAGGAAARLNVPNVPGSGRS